jgi:stage II sporulation protein D
MKKIVCYILLMIVIIILLPLLIVKGCSFEQPDTPQEHPLLEEEIKVRVYIAPEEKTVEMELEEYLKGVVTAEMPAEFEPEALKAQAVAARTYVYGRIKKIYTPKDNSHVEADICTDPTHCQAWVSEADAKKKWGIFSANKYWKKIVKAVAETRHIIITYNDKIVNPVFHSNSGGRTENAEDVWDGSGEPYLKSVVSSGEEAYPDYQYTISIKESDFCGILREQYPEIILNEEDILNDIEILDYTEGGRVKIIKIGNVEIKGTEFRKLFSLRSANFKIEEGESDCLKITTIGYGHGVGMSQWGANNLAKNGGTYEEIIKYYYLGVDLKTIEEYEK